MPSRQEQLTLLLERLERVESSVSGIAAFITGEPSKPFAPTGKAKRTAQPERKATATGKKQAGRSRGKAHSEAIKRGQEARRKKLAAEARAKAKATK